MNHLLIHQISDEIKQVQQENKKVINLFNLASYYAVIFWLQTTFPNIEISEKAIDIIRHQTSYPFASKRVFEVSSNNELFTSDPLLKLKSVEQFYKIVEEFTF